MKTNIDSNTAFWSVVLKLSREIYDIYSFVFEESHHHLPVLSKDQFNTIKRVSKCAHDLGQLSCSMIAKLDDDAKSSDI